jgi:hypothetical protein
LLFLPLDFFERLPPTTGLVFIEGIEGIEGIERDEFIEGKGAATVGAGFAASEEPELFFFGTDNAPPILFSGVYYRKVTNFGIRDQPYCCH